MTALETGLVLGFIGVVAAGVQGGLIRPLAKRFDEAQLIRAGTAIQALAFAGLAASPTFGRGALYAAGGLLALGNGLTQPSVSAYVSKRADPKAQGGTLGTNQSAASLARVFGPALGGWLYGALGRALAVRRRRDRHGARDRASRCSSSRRRGRADQRNTSTHTS